jgi:hypothetical protein
MRPLFPLDRPLFEMGGGVALVVSGLHSGEGIVLYTSVLWTADTD